MAEDKIYSIGKVAKLIKVQVHTIRFWTDEFPENINPIIKGGGRRYYKEKDLKTFKKIKTFIHTEGIRIKSIRERKLLTQNPNNETDCIYEKLNQVKIILMEVLKILQ